MAEEDRLADDGFAREIRDLTGAALRVVLAIGAGGFALFAVLDYMVLPDLFNELVRIRIATVVGFGIIYVFARRDTTHRWSGALAVAAFCGSALSIQLMVLKTGGHTSEYYAGLNLVLVGAAVLMPWHWTRSLIVFLGVFGLYNLSILLADDSLLSPDARPGMFWISNFFILFTGVIAVAATWRLYASRGLAFHARSQLETLADFRKNVIANLSHEMRTPLTLLLGAVNKVLKDERRSQDEIELLQDGKQSGLELLQLINDLLELSRIDAAMEYVTLDRLRSDVLLYDILRMTERYAERNGITIETTSHEPISLVGDRRKIDRILKNLVSNGLKFTPRGGRITLSCEAHGDDYVVFGVKDTGPGVPEALRERVFERFRQVDSGSSRRHGGTGIGLALVREHVEMHGGKVWIEGPAEGGAFARVRLPRTADLIPQDRINRRTLSIAADDSDREDEGQDVSAWTQVLVDDPEYQAVQLANATERRAGVRPSRARYSGRILIVDDTPAILRLLSYQLCGEHDVVLARSGHEALELTHKWKPSVIVTDMMMPEMDGAELCRRLAEGDETAAIPVVLLTARTGEEARLEARKAGAVAFLTKPCDEEELLATIDAILAKQTETARDVADYSTRTTAFVAEGIAHEIRNPLGFVMNAQFLLAHVATQALEASQDALDPESLERLRKTLVEAQNSGQQGIDRINQMVDQVASLAEEGALADGQCDAASVVDKVRQLISPRLSEHELFVDVQPVKVSIAAGPLHDVVLNLVKNALEALDEPGRIEILGQVAGARYELRVVDHGSGIAPEVRKQLFQPFFTTKAPGEGTGLGLAVSRRKVATGGGTLELEDKSACTSFLIRLPLLTSRYKPATSQPPSPLVLPPDTAHRDSDSPLPS